MRVGSGWDAGIDAAGGVGGVFSAGQGISAGGGGGRGQGIPAGGATPRMELLSTGVSCEYDVYDQLDEGREGE